VAIVLFRGELLFFQFQNSSFEELQRMTWCVKLLFVNVLVHAFFAIYSTLLTSTSFERPVSWLVFMSIGLNVGLNFLLLPRYGAVAAALNTLICAVFVSAGYVWLVQFRARIEVPWGWLFRLASVFALLCAAWYGLRYGLALPWLVESAVAGLVFAGLLVALGIVRIQEVKALLHRSAKS
jgi:O-antigen/teichoic acid export membrane protein